MRVMRACAPVSVCYSYCACAPARHRHRRSAGRMTVTAVSVVISVSSMSDDAPSIDFAPHAVCAPARYITHTRALL